MTPLENAKRLWKHDPVAEHDFGSGCLFCGGRAHLPYGGVWQIHHKPDCPWFSMGAIVAALEAAEAVLNAADDAAYQNWSVSIPRPVVKALYGLERALGDDVVTRTVQP